MSLRPKRIHDFFTVDYPGLLYKPANVTDEQIEILKTLFPEKIAESSVSMFSYVSGLVFGNNDQILNIFIKIFNPDKLIAQYLGLDKWNDGSDEVKNKIIEAYKKDSITLELPSNKLPSLPDGIDKLTNLTLLDVSDNEIETFPDIKHLVNLTLLNVSNNQLASLPNSVWQLPNLDTLTINHNLLNTIPEVNLPKLRILEINHNYLTEVSDSIKNCTNLAELDLSFNHITRVSPEIGKLVNLTILRLTKNELTELPSEIVKLKKLRDLLIARNQLTDLPNLLELADLVFLDYSSNNIAVDPRSRISRSLATHRFNGNPFTDKATPPPTPSTKTGKKRGLDDI
jgi:Leucine-rich repeat (LRR) protein